MAVLRKMRKLVRHPVLFFTDAVNKNISKDKSNATPEAARSLEFNFPRSELACLKFIIHAGDGAGSEFQFLNWLTELQKSYQPFAVMIRSLPVYVEASKRITGCNLIYAKDANGVENVMNRMSNLQLVLYVSNTGNNIHLLRNNHLTHAFIGHGDSEKSASCHKFFRAYDEIWVSGQAHEDRFLNANFKPGHLEFIRVGRSSLQGQVNYAPTQNGQPPATEATGCSRKFLYLPTWEGAFDDSSYASLEYTNQIITTLCEQGTYQGAIKLHPLTGRRKTALATLEESLFARFGQDRLRVISRMDLPINHFSGVDFLISDISSVITDFLVTQKPIFVYWPGFKNLLMAESKFSIKDYCYAYSTISELLSLVEDVINFGNDPLAGMRRNALNYYIDLEATAQGAFQREIVRACTPTLTKPTALISVEPV